MKDGLREDPGVGAEVVVRYYLDRAPGRRGEQVLHRAGCRLVTPAASFLGSFPTLEAAVRKAGKQGVQLDVCPECCGEWGL